MFVRFFDNCLWKELVNKILILIVFIVVKICLEFDVVGGVYSGVENVGSIVNNSFMLY